MSVVDVCRHCGFVGVYEGVFSVACVNPDCSRFDVNHAKVWIQVETRRLAVAMLLGHVHSAELPWPKAFQLSHPTPTSVRFDWPQPDVPEDDRLCFVVEF